MEEPRFFPAAYGGRATKLNQISPVSVLTGFNIVEKRGVSGVVTVRKAIELDPFGSRSTSYEYTRTEHVYHACCEEEDHNFLGFSNGINRCRCLRGYCEGRDGDCMRDPGVIAALLRGKSA
jgi:hypothetical protein